MEFKLASRPPEDEELMRRPRRWPRKTIFISWDNWTKRNEHKVTYIITYIFVISALFLPRAHQLQHTWSHSILGAFHASILDSHHYSVGVLESVLVLLICLTCLYPSAWLMMEFQGYTHTRGHVNLSCGGHGGGERAVGRRRRGNCVALCHNLHGNQFVPSSHATTSSFTTVMT